MRRAGICPKCEGRKFWCVKQPTGPAPARQQAVGFLTTEIEDVGRFEVFICCGCGYSEWYANGLERLKADPSIGVHAVDRTPEGAGPYR